MMTAPERGILLLCCALGDREARPLSTARFRELSKRAAALGLPEGAEPSADVREKDLRRLGCSAAEAAQVTALLAREDRLEQYLETARLHGLFPLLRGHGGYPVPLQRKLGMSCPPVFFCAGNAMLLRGRFAGLAGSRRASAEGLAFAARVGELAAREGLTLVTGGAEGADAAALAACLQSGGSAVVFVPDDLRRRASMAGPRCLVCSEGGYDLPFSARRALARNACVHAMGEMTVIAQTGFGKGGTWKGAVENLRHAWSQLYVFADGSPGAAALAERGAVPVTSLTTLSGLQPLQDCLF